MSDTERIAFIEHASTEYLVGIREIRRVYHEKVDEILKDIRHRTLRELRTQIDSTA